MFVSAMTLNEPGFFKYVRLVQHSREYELSNSIQELPDFIVALIEQVSDQLSAERRDSLRVALLEVVINAIEHGNLEISLDEKAAALEAGKFENLVAERVLDPKFSKRKVRVKLQLLSDQIKIEVRDDGKGFDWTNLPDPTDLENILKVCGRGLLIARRSVDKLKFNRAGNRVTLITYLKTPKDKPS